jgi:hypothetical protein
MCELRGRLQIFSEFGIRFAISGFPATASAKQAQDKIATTLLGYAPREDRTFSSGETPMLDRLDDKAIQKVSGPSWARLKESFLEISRRLLSAAPDTTAELTTIYVKYCTTQTRTEVFAVAWLRTSKEIVVGMSLPESIEHARLGNARPGMNYKGLTKYFGVTVDNPVPDELEEWARLAYETATSPKTSG